MVLGTHMRRVELLYYDLANIRVIRSALPRLDYISTQVSNRSAQYRST
jgi:hypothetical protein|uniref:Uncharacterized protein n=1 Tax=Picea glauca TaxID=3330 RepID=A0A101M1H8_PICGL|nr:hypothetical protein ABT39_MTgene3873 [Picea glauca]